MEKLKIWFCDFWNEWKDEDFISPILNKHFELVLDKQNPDVVFHSIFNGMRETPTYKCKKILFLGENHRPQTFKSDYSISFDPQTNTNYRLPLWQVYLMLKPELQDILFGPRIHHDKFDKFASFVVSNPSNAVRNNFFNLFIFQSWAYISSYGRYLANDHSLLQASHGRYWRDAKYEFFIKNKHQYAITFENNSYPGYITEKLMDAFLGGSMPIYWGDINVGEDWNVNAFINANNGIKYAYDTMRKQSNDHSLFEAMYKESIFSDEQRKRHINNIKLFETWLIEKIKT